MKIVYRKIAPLLSRMMILTPYKQTDPLDCAVLTIDLAALVANYRRLDEQAGKTETACVVKADAYGLGLAQVAPALLSAGCRTFFVAQAAEGAALRALAKEADIYILNGLAVGNAAGLAQYELRPCLGALAEISEWMDFCAAEKKSHPAALHIDTGFNRLGLTEAELTEIDSRFTPALIMSHLACADRPDHAMNSEQLERFRRAIAHFPDTQACLANSAGISLGSDYHFDMVRAGIGLYKSTARPMTDNTDPHPVITLQAPVLQLRTVQAGETIGYEAFFKAEKNMRLAIIAIGYGDGYLRQLGKPRPPFAQAALDGQRLPIIGRISMDLLAVDISALPEAQVQRGTMLELIGTHIPLDETARCADSIAYELLTRLGTRAKRVYKS